MSKAPICGGAAALAKALKVNTGDEGVAALAEALKVNTAHTTYVCSIFFIRS